MATTKKLDLLKATELTSDIIAHYTKQGGNNKSFLVNPELTCVTAFANYRTADEGEYEELKNRIKADGRIKQACHIDQHGNMISGFNRRQICIELGLPLLITVDKVKLIEIEDLDEVESLMTGYNKNIKVKASDTAKQVRKWFNNGKDVKWISDAIGKTPKEVYEELKIKHDNDVVKEMQGKESSKAKQVAYSKIVGTEYDTEGMKNLYLSDLKGAELQKAVNRERAKVDLAKLRENAPDQEFIPVPSANLKRLLKKEKDIKDFLEENPAPALQSIFDYIFEMDQETLDKKELDHKAAVASHNEEIRKENQRINGKPKKAKKKAVKKSFESMTKEEQAQYIADLQAGMKKD